MSENAELFAELRPPLSSETALLEADRCLECGGLYAPAPCALACPAGVDVPAFIAALAEGDPVAGGRVVFAENLLGGTCARVCPVEVLCEGACVLVHEGRRPIAIGSLQRFAVEAALNAGTVLRERAPDSGFAVAVVGAGPSGMACAGELAALGHAVTVYDERKEVGGLARYAIAPYRQLRDPLPAEARMLEQLGVEFRLSTPVGAPAFAALAADFDAVYLGVGMGADASLRLPGDELGGVWDSLPFIEALKGGNLHHTGRRVVVIGGGNTAIDVARESVRLGADLVTVVYRRTRAEMPAYEFEVEEAEEEGVHFRWLAAPVRFVGEDRLEGVECVAMTLGAAGPDGRRRPEPVDGSEFLLAADCAVKAVGQQARLELVECIDGAAFRHGMLQVEPLTGRIGGTRFFAGGDVINGGASVVEAVRDGKRAAHAIDEWLRCPA